MLYTKENTPCICSTSFTVESSRLLLRPIVLEDAAIIFSEFTPEITHYMAPPSPSKIDDTKRFISEAITQREKGSDLVLTITQRETGEFLGVCGLHGSIQHEFPELGLWIKKSAHGKKYGLEAITILKTWAEKTLVVQGFIYPVDKQNGASRRIPESFGGSIISERKVTTHDNRLLDEVVYRIPVHQL